MFGAGDLSVPMLVHATDVEWGTPARAIVAPGDLTYGLARAAQSAADPEGKSAGPAAHQQPAAGVRSTIAQGEYAVAADQHSATGAQGEHATAGTADQYSAASAEGQHATAGAADPETTYWEHLGVTVGKENPVYNSRRIAFLSDRDGNVNIYTVNERGGDLQQITRNEVDEIALVWGADGRIVFESRPTGRSILYIAERDGAQRALSAGSAPASQPNW